MSTLAQLGMIDIRHLLPRQKWEIGRRPGAPTSWTLHYAGAESPVPTAIQNDRQRLIAFIRDIYVPNHVKRIGADGLQYHFVVTAAGEILQCRDLNAELWHCANADGNLWSVAVHLPMGGTQQPTAIQWARAGALFDAGISEFRMAGRTVVRGHSEWPKFQKINGRLLQITNSECPGVVLMPRLRTWRTQANTRYRCITPATVRQGPGRAFPIAATLAQGTIFEGDKVLSGVPVAGDARWVHRLDELGFVHMSALQVAV